LCCYTPQVPLSFIVYAQRLVVPGYAGPIYKLRRDSDNATMDFFPAPIDVDQAAITTWLGGANGFVDTWYDQSTFALHAHSPAFIGGPSVFAQQPQWIANAQGGRPGINFGLTTYMQPPNNAAIQQWLVSRPPFITAPILFDGSATIFMALALQNSTAWPSLVAGYYETSAFGFFKGGLSNTISNVFQVTPGPQSLAGSSYITGAKHAEAIFKETFDGAFHLWDNAIGIGIEDFILDGTPLPLNTSPLETPPLGPIQGTGLYIQIGEASNVPLYGTFQELRLYNQGALATRAAVRADIRAYYSLP
jgi:hypothetical protein